MMAFADNGEPLILSLSGIAKVLVFEGNNIKLYLFLTSRLIVAGVSPLLTNIA